MDLNNLNSYEKEFKKAVSNAGIPVTEDGIKSEFQTIVDASELTITNSSAFSPFWNLVTQLITKPVFWLIVFIIRVIMVNYFVKTATGAFLDLIAYGYDIERKTATKAQGVLTFSRDSIGQPLTIPANTVVKTLSINGNVYRVIVTADTDFETDSYTVSVPVEAVETGSAYNLASDYYIILEEEISGVTGVTNAEEWLSVPGTDLEPDEELRLRVRNQFTAVSEYHTDAKYRAMITALTGFSADRLYFLHDIPRGPGSADAYMLFDTYTPAQTYLDSVNAYINAQGNHGHGDDLQVKAVPYLDTNIGVSVYFKNLVLDKESALEEIEQFIRCAFRENSEYDDYCTKPLPHQRFSFARLGQELLNYFPDTIESLIWAQADLLPELEVPRIDELTIIEGS